MQIESGFPATLDWIIHGGTVSMIVGAFWLGAKINARLTRDEMLNRNFPPHKHVGTNGSSVIIYADEYQPSKVERFGGRGGDLT